MEGDLKITVDTADHKLFLSTPSGWRATGDGFVLEQGYNVSIHALRVEGDILHYAPNNWKTISIHALRVEGVVASSHIGGGV